MKHSWKKLISGVLAASMVLSMLGTGVLAAGEDEVLHDHDLTADELVSVGGTVVAEEDNDVELAADTDPGTYTFTGGTQPSGYFSALGTLTVDGDYTVTATKSFAGGVQFTVTGSADVTVVAKAVSSGAPGLKGSALVADDDGQSRDGNRPTSDTTFTYSDLPEGTYTVGNIRTSGSSVGIKSIVVVQKAHIHSTTKVGAKAATCAEAGNNEYYTCACGKVFKDAAATQETTVADETLAKVSHSYDAVSAVPATCITPGSEAGQKCSVCGDVTGCAVIPATGEHTYGADGKCTTEGCTAVDPDTCTHTNKGTIAHVDAECGKPGVVGGEYCVDCGDGKAAAETAIPALEHNFVSGVCDKCGAKETTGFLSEGGWLESAYALWYIGAGVSKYTAFVKEEGGSYTQLDDQLIRQYPSYMRVDALGLKGGKSYVIKVVPDGNEAKAMETNPLAVKAHDRTGFGFVNGSSSGAYNDDGTLKAGAEVVYVTNSNFETVTLTVKNAKGADVTFTGVQAIVDESGVSKISNGTPVCVRVIGAIDLTGFPTGSWKSEQGLQVKAANATKNKNLTIEGVGNDATFNGFGMLIRNCSNVEVRNLGILNFADDGVSIDTGNDHLWIHNNDFFYGGPGSDNDQVKGDGSLDSKGIQYATESYNHFWDSGKCCLMGMGGGKDHYISYHHNWFDHSDSRHPRIREAEVHIYNNYYDTNAKYGVGAALDCSAFVEGNYFNNCKYPMLMGYEGSDRTSGGGSNTFEDSTGGFIKAYNNTIAGEKAFITQKDADSFDAYVVDSRSQTVGSTTVSATYNNFDTKVDLGVTAAQIESPEQAMKTVTQWAGRVQGGDFQYEFDEETQHWSAGDKIAAGVISDLKSKVVNYKGTMVKVGGTVDTAKVDTAEHVCKDGRWVVTEAPNGTSKGVKTQYCVICGEEMRTAEVGATTAGGGGLKKTLTYSHFKESKHVDNYAVTQADLDKLYGDESATANSGYFKVVGNKVLLRATNKNSSALTCIQLPKGGGSGISFTVANAPATVKVEFASTSSGQKSTLVMKDSAGTPVADTNGATSISNNKGLSTPTSVEYELTTAGTYTVSASEDNTASDYNVRLLSLSVEAPCEHEATTHHPAVAATCTKDGNREHWTCNNCRKSFADAACENAISDITIEASGHKWGEWVVSADGKTQTRTCSACKTTETEDVDNGKPDEPDQPVAVTGVSLSPSKLTLWADGDGTKEATLTAAVSPSNADNKSVTWSSSAPGVATVVNGKVTAVAAGNATITVTTADGGKTATCAVTVKTTGSVTTTSGKKLDATKDFGNITETAKVGDEIVKGQNDEVPIVSSEMTALHDGYFSVTGDVTKRVASGGTPKAIKNSAAVTHIEVKPAEASSVNFTIAANTTAAVTLKVSSTGGSNWSAVELQKKDGDNWVGVKATITAAANELQMLAGSETIPVFYSTAERTVTFSGLEAGDYRVVSPADAAGEGSYTKYDGTVTAEADMPKKSDGSNDTAAYPFTRNARIFSLEVTETTASGGDAEKPVTGVSLDKNTLALDVNGTKTGQLTATVTPAEATDPSVSWTTSDASIATVDQTGKVTAVAAGNVTITVTTTDGGKTATCAVTVTGKSEGGNGGGGGGGGGSSASAPTPTPTPTPDDKPDATSFPFVDVPETHWGRSTVEKMYEKGLITGTDETHFSPSMTTSRAMVATIIWRMAGQPKVDAAAGFPDVAEGTWYTDAVAWAASVGVVNGYDNGNFGPMDDVTREQVALMLSRYAALGKEDTTPDAGEGDVLADFADQAAVDNWASEAMSWAVNAGIITGREGKLLAPAADASRAEFCTMAIRFLELDETEAAK